MNDVRNTTIARLGSAFALGLAITTASAGAQSVPNATPAPSPSGQPGQQPGAGTILPPTSGATPGTMQPAPGSMKPTPGAMQPSPGAMQQTPGMGKMKGEMQSPGMSGGSMSSDGATTMPASTYDGKPIDALANNPNGANWLQKFARPVSGDAKAMMKPMKRVPTTKMK